MTKHKFRLNGTKEYPIIICLHGFTSSITDVIEWGRVYNLAGYEVIGFNAVGHGGRNGKKWSWMKTVERYHKVINAISKPTVVIGHSMGGTEAIHLCKNRYVKQVFAISALHGNGVFENPSWFMKRRFRNHLDEKQKKKITAAIYPVLPINYTLTKLQSKKLHLIHDRNDNFIKVDHYYKNKAKFHVHQNRCLLTRFQGHLAPPYVPITQSWILDKIEKL